METRNIALTLEKAKEWYNSGNEALKEAALQAFTKDELIRSNFKSIKTFEDAAKSLYSSSDVVHIIHTIMNVHRISKASAATLKLNIIRKALNKGYEMKFDEGEIWHPNNPIIVGGTYHPTSENEIEVAKVKVDNKICTLIGGGAYYGTAGLGCFSSYHHSSIGFAGADIGFLGCATREIAKHFSKYFAKEIFEAKYGDSISFEFD